VVVTKQVSEGVCERQRRGDGFGNGERGFANSELAADD